MITEIGISSRTIAKCEVETHHISDITKYLIKQDEAKGSRIHGKEENAAHRDRGFFYMKHINIGISSYLFPFACGNHPEQLPKERLTPEGLIKKAVELGVNCVQICDNIPIDKMSNEELQEVAKLAKANDLIVEIGMGKMTPERIGRFVDICKIFDAKVLRGITDGPDFEPDIEEIIEILKDAAPRLEEKEITFAVENHDRFKAVDYARIVESVNSPFVRLVVDMTNSMSIEEKVETVVEKMAPYCACLHMKDYIIRRNNSGFGVEVTSVPLGEGWLDIPEMIRKVCAATDRDFNIIMESWMAPCATLGESLRQENEWAKKGIEYLRGVLTEKAG